MFYKFPWIYTLTDGEEAVPRQGLFLSPYCIRFILYLPAFKKYNAYNYNTNKTQPGYKLRFMSIFIAKWNFKNSYLIFDTTTHFLED